MLAFASCDVRPMKKTSSRFHSHGRIVRENMELVNLCLCVVRFVLASWFVFTRYESLVLASLVKTRLKLLRQLNYVNKSTMLIHNMIHK